MAAKVGKKGKKKGQKMALTDFLSDEQGNTAGPGTSYVLANKTVDWAQEMEDLDNTVDTPYSLTTSVDRAKLPTAPKAARILEDLDSVPKEPPFTAFIGNLPYEVSEEKIKEFFQKLSVVNVRLPEENGRFRGFGYVQFDTRQGLIDALTKNEDTLAGRKIRVDLADQSQHGGSKDGKGGGGRDEGPDRTQGDWRRSEPEDRGPSRSFDDRGPSRGFDDRGPSRGFDDRGGRGFEDRGGSRGGFGGRNYDDRGGRGGFEDRGGRGFDDRGGRGYDDRRGGGFQGGRDRHDDRDGGRRGFGSGFRDGDRRDDRGGYGNRDRSDRDTWERGPAIDRSNERDTWERGPAVDRSNERDVRPSYRSERPESREPDNTPKERPRLQLQPRSKPADDSGLSQAEKDAKSASIFGGAKPIDTARREREIEERLQKQRDAPPPRSEPESRGYGMSRGYDDPRGDRRYDHDNKENKEIPKLERGSRKKSEGSDQEGERRRHSSSSSSKGKKGSRGRRESGESGGHPDVLSEGEGDKGHNAVSSPTGREEPAVFVPAPPPKQNIWEVRKTTQTTSPPQKTTGPSSPPVQESKSQTRTASTPDKTVNQTINQSDNESTRSTQPSQQNVSHSNHSNGTKKDLVPADPPKENPWARRKQEMDKQPPSRPSQPSSSDSVPPRTGASAGPPNAWAGRGRGGDRGRGRGGGAGRGRGGEPPKPKQERREKPLPNSIDEMPKLETKAAKDFSDGNKFANLLDDADDVDE